MRAVERERFQFAHRRHQDRAARRLIAAARLHADKAILDQVDAADAVFAADSFNCSSRATAAELPLAVQRNRNAVFESNGDFSRLVRRLCGTLA